MIGKDVKIAVELLSKGEVIGIPTETVYGLAGSAVNKSAILKIFEVKNRPFFDPLIVHIASMELIEQYVLELNDLSRLLASHFMPGPLTLLLPKKNIIPDLVTAGSALVAIRIPSHPLTRELLGKLDFPVAAPSANPFGYISPTNARHVEQQLGEKIPYILDGGPSNIGVESTIVSVVKEKVVVHRKGGITIESLEAIAGEVTILEKSTNKPLAPGTLSSHYAPKTPIEIGITNKQLTQYAGKKIGVLSFQESRIDLPREHQVVLSAKGDLKEAAFNFFSSLRYLDGLDLDIILAEYFPEIGLGRALNDRLKRASA